MCRGTVPRADDITPPPPPPPPQPATGIAGRRDDRFRTLRRRRWAHHFPNSANSEAPTVSLAATDELTCTADHRGGGAPCGALFPFLVGTLVDQTLPNLQRELEWRAIRSDVQTNLPSQRITRKNAHPSSGVDKEIATC